MKYVLACFMAILAAAQADPAISSLEWRPACDGSTIEIASDGKKIRSVRAIAFHSAAIVEWTVHYIDGVPASAEYRESDRGRIRQGDDAGHYSGRNVLRTIQTWRWDGTRFPIVDDTRHEELLEILARAETQTASGGENASPLPTSH